MVQELINLDLRQYIRDIHDFPKSGIVYKDITPLLADAQALKATHLQLAKRLKHLKINKIASPESRGFIFGIGLALEMGIGFVPIRKPGKLPSETYHVHYDLEYGSDRLEIHKDALKKGDRVLLVDDLLATGGTIKAASELIEKCGAEAVGYGFVIELAFLEGAKKLKLAGKPVESLITY